MAADAFAGGEGLTIARRLDFDGPQPNYFGIARASASPLRAGDFTGNVAGGGSCNAEAVEFVPHCHGTHTEGIGHISAARIDVIDCIPRRALPALLISMPERRAADVADHKAPATEDGDRVLALADLKPALDAAPGIEAVVIRTLPNPAAKRVAQYTDSDDYACLTLDAMAVIVDAGIRHLLIDTPSLDRLDDGGRLSVHRVFWGMPERSTDAADAAHPDATVTEMIYVPDAIADGRYRVLIQPAPFAGDATPSNPLLFDEPET